MRCRPDRRQCRMVGKKSPIYAHPTCEAFSSFIKRSNQKRYSAELRAPDAANAQYATDVVGSLPNSSIAASTASSSLKVSHPRITGLPMFMTLSPFVYCAQARLTSLRLHPGLAAHLSAYQHQCARPRNGQGVAVGLFMPCQRPAGPRIPTRGVKIRRVRERASEHGRNVLRRLLFERA